MTAIDACTVDRLRATLVAARDALDPAHGTILHCDRAAFAWTRSALCACVRELVPLGSHPVLPRASGVMTTAIDVLRALDDGELRMRAIILASATLPEHRATLVRALSQLNAATTDLLRVIGEATYAAAQDRAAA